MGAQHDDEAAVLGVHVEGPFLAPDWRGAHDPEIVRTATAAELVELVEYAGGLVRMVTLAPERDGAAACIRALARSEVVVAAGHTGATAAELAAAADLGVRAVTHLYNAQTGLHHRELGVVGQTLLDDRLTATVIADAEHLAPGALQLAFAAKPGRIALVTDSVAAAGLPPGRHRMPDGEVVVVAGAPPRRPDGRLAGSALRMDQAVRNAVRAGISLPAALRAASTVPADLVGHRALGRLEPGCAADLVWLDAGLQVRQVWRSGRRIHPRPHAPRARA
jgi:N-acetylglucosamine-6-phosphate deacetylase